MLKRNSFNLSHYKNIAFPMGYLIPTCVIECFPGDTHVISNKLFLRLAPQVFPTLHNVNVKTLYFKVPHRLVWDNFKEFRTGGVDGKFEVPHPCMTSPEGGYKIGSLADYLGIPTGKANIEHNALPFRMYNLIYNEFFRNQTLMNEVAISRGDGEDIVTSRDLLKVCWQKDRFTNAQPFEQRGEAVNLPIGGELPVIFDSKIKVNQIVDTGGVVRGSIGNASGNNRAVLQAHHEGDTFNVDDVGGLQNSADPHAHVDLADGNVITVNDFRVAVQLQKLFEKMARFGARYVEFLYALFGVRSSDARLQRPEFLGSAVSPIVFSEVLQTSSTDEVSPQGSMAGHGVSAQSTHKIKTFCEEDCFIIGLSYVMPQTMYFQGVPKWATRKTRLDYCTPTFVNLGVQPIWNYEVFAQGVHVKDEHNFPVDLGIFGFEDRYDEFRFMQNTVHGDFRGNLMDYHMGRYFENLPVLSSRFVQADPTSRTFAVQTPGNQNIYMTIQNEIHSLRCLPKVGVPGLVDHN